MKYLSLKILVLCILLPPLLYIVSIQALESYLQARYSARIEKIYICSTCPFFDGSIRLKDSINEIMDHYLRNDVMIAIGGVKAGVLIATKQGNILYPAVFSSFAADADDKDTSLSNSDPSNSDPLQIAIENYRLLNEGLKVSVDIKVEHNTLLSNIILGMYILIFVFALYFYYSAGIRKNRADELKKNMEIDRLREQEKEYRDKLRSLEADKELLTNSIEQTRKALQDEKQKATTNEEEMIDEFVTLEETLKQNLKLQTEQQEEIAALTEKLQQYEKRKEVKPKRKNYDVVAKRFKALYKNIDVHRKAIDGYLELTDELKIKAEEIIHQLNENPKLVTIKRKVFGNKTSITVLEVLFSYNGRLYFRTLKDGKVEILVIGTKNSQVKDLEFINNL